MAKRGLPSREYDLLEQIGTGSFGTVHRAANKVTHEIVAIKVMKKSVKGDCSNAREHRTLRNLAPHPNIVRLYDSYIGPAKELYFVIEYMNQGNLYQLIKQRREMNHPLEHPKVRSILRQILTALAHLHQQGIFHRDMKPENILIGSASSADAIVIKLADFGLAREIKSRPPYTEYVSTRWYRAPEVLLHSTQYSSPVDLWAVGAIFAELVTLKPLFPGRSEIDQLFRICQVLGNPTGIAMKRRLTPLRKKSDPPPPLNDFAQPTATDPARDWPDGIKLAHKIGFDFPQMSPKSLSTILPTASEPMLDLLHQLLIFDPTKRINATDALKSTFLRKTRIVMYNDEDDAVPPAPRKSMLWSKGVSMAPADKPPGNNILLRLSKSKTMDRLQRKKPSLTSIRIAAANIGKSVSSYDFQNQPSTTDPCINNTIDDKTLDRAFDLPSIPVLSPIQMCSDWNSGTRVQQDCK
ncbi:kinase-like domain-containing protein [Fennellomyces sp. T-0311]|nr:kinase-like domain-containing protein [Fennellomyces sp. T-0311]